MAFVGQVGILVSAYHAQRLQEAKIVTHVCMWLFAAWRRLLALTVRQLGGLDSFTGV